MDIAHGSFVITGAASGMGAATAQRLCALQARLILLDKDEQALQQVADCCAHARVIAADVCDTDTIEQELAKTKAQCGPIRGLINCAGIAPAQRVLGRDGVMALDDFEQVIRVNLVGTFNIIRLVASHMATQDPTQDGHRGIIINTASVAAFEGQIGQAAYSASKGGIVGMTLPLAREFASTAIRVMTIAPGLMDTPLVAGMPEGIQHALAQQIPYPHRFGQADEFAALVQHIIENDYLNGEVIRLDGALRMQAK